MKVKKISALAAAVITAFSSVLTIPQNITYADSEELSDTGRYYPDGDYKWYLFDDHAELEKLENHEADTELVIPGSVEDLPVTVIRGGALYDCEKLVSLTLPDSLAEFQGTLFPLLELEEINISENAENFVSVDGVLYSKDMTSLRFYPLAHKETEYTVPEGVVSIEMNAFANCLNLKSVKLPETLTEIGYAAFSYCPELVDITLPENVEIIGHFAFSDCIKAENLHIPEKTKSVGFHAFYNVPSVTKIHGIHYLDGWIIDSDSDITEALIPDSIVSLTDNSTMNINKIAAGAFILRTKITSLYIPKSINYMQKSAFSGCENLKTAEIYSSVIGETAFRSCTSLEEIYIYDPACDIYDDEKTIPPQYTIESSSFYTISVTIDDSTYGDTAIYGYEDSTAKQYAEKYGRKFVSLGEAPAEEMRYGDANDDGNIGIADAVLILQSISNPDKYSLSAAGKFRADVYNRGDGITARDALSIQMFEANALTSLPENTEE